MQQQVAWANGLFFPNFKKAVSRDYLTTSIFFFKQALLINQLYCKIVLHVFYMQ